MSYQTEILTDSPLLYYEHEESSGTTLDDSSGNDLDGSYAASGVTYAATGPLIPEDTTGVSFDGIAGRFTSASLTTTNRPTYPFVVECWAKPASATPSLGENLLRLESSDQSEQVIIKVGAGNVWQASVADSSETANITAGAITGGWQHIALRVVDATTRHLYVDGSLAGSETSTSVTWTGSVASYTLSGGWDGSSDYFAVSMSRTALYNADVTASRIDEHYALAAYDEPINEKIALRVKARMDTITTANGYKFNASVLREDPQRGQSPYDSLLVVYEGDESRDEPETQGSSTWLKPVSVVCHAVETDGASTNLRTRANRMAADVYKAVMTDEFWDDGTGAGVCLALNTFIRPPIQVPPESGGIHAVEANFDIQYRTSDTNPYIAP